MASSSSSTHNPPAVANDNPFRCNIAGCQSTFHFSADRYWHTYIEHHQIYPFICPAPNCIYYSFVRDVMVDHLRDTHEVLLAKKQGRERWVHHWANLRATLHSWLIHRGIQNPDLSSCQPDPQGDFATGFASGANDDEWYTSFGHSKGLHYDLIKFCNKVDRGEAVGNFETVFAMCCLLPDFETFDAFCNHRKQFVKHGIERTDQVVFIAMKRWLGMYPAINNSLLQELIQDLTALDAEDGQWRD